MNFTLDASIARAMRAGAYIKQNSGLARPNSIVFEWSCDDRAGLGHKIDIRRMAAHIFRRPVLPTDVFISAILYNW
ncbi:hypothetical protein AJ88_43420 [Mesorhizobium amorphae CCBAU 01583]|nr:hypothetical protein AJ88_43420 [Mesorhizobium amorphae CCBAU 01583]